MKKILAAASLFVLAGAVTVYACCGGPTQPPPVINSLTPSVDCLWPPNHKMVTVGIDADITGDPGSLTWQVYFAMSNELDNGLGDGDTEGDIGLLGGQTIDLRAERAGPDSGRIYTVGVMAQDIGGVAYGFFEVCVPHDMRKAK